jgi:hypothetical protein
MDPEKQGKTLWERLMERLRSGNGEGIAFENPLDLRVGAPVAIAAAQGPDYANYTFTVQEIREYTRRIGEKEFRFTDYVLRGVNTNTFAAGDVMSARMRVVPNAAGAHDRLLLRLYDEFAFAEDFLGVLGDPSGLLEVSEERTDTMHEFYRINELREPYEAAVLVVAGTTPEGKAVSGNCSSLKLRYWDYWRDQETEAKEFLFVEQNEETGWFQIWRGTEQFEV